MHRNGAGRWNFNCNKGLYVDKSWSGLFKEKEKGHDPSDGSTLMKKKLVHSLDQLTLGGWFKKSLIHYSTVSQSSYYSINNSIKLEGERGLSQPVVGPFRGLYKSIKVTQNK